MNSYHLQPYVLGRPPSVELTKAEYDGLLAALHRAFEHLAIEELFNVLMGNYEEFERELLSIALRFATFMGRIDDQVGSVDALHDVGRRLANLLTTTHAYCDQLPHAVSTLFGRDSSELQQVRDYFRAEHSSQFSYRVCTELRKFMQHRGTAVHQLNREMAWVDRPNGRRVRAYWVTPQVSVNRLREDTKFKPSVLADLETSALETAYGELLHDLRPFLRDYVSALGRVHLKTRTLLSDSVARSEGTILTAIERFVSVGGPEVLGLAAMELNERQLLEDRHPTFVSRYAIDRRVLLENRNRLPTHFDTQVITNEIS